MLMTVLRGDFAVSQSKQLIRCCKLMKDYIIESISLLTYTDSYIESRFTSYDKRFEQIENKLNVTMDSTPLSIFRLSQPVFYRGSSPLPSYQLVFWIRNRSLVMGNP